MLNIGAQYYRAPFPEKKYWEDDLARMADSGLNTVQLWILWAWVESEPGKFQFDDYDQLIELADKNGLGVVLSTIAEIQPYWIHRVVPGCELVDNMGHRVISSNRNECHHGLTPGGCFDHPDLWERMSGFLKAVVSRYASLPHLRGWDAWNELRWNVNADGLVCFCPHTIARFHQWLDVKYGGLEGLNKDWARRYAAWEDVRPGKMPRSPYTEMMAFQQFISWRSCMHAKARYEVMKPLDSRHPVTLHGGNPSLESSGIYPAAMAQDRGNDWHYDEFMDGVGCSSFPAWGRLMDQAAFSIRIDDVASAANKLLWLSELQGGRASSAFTLQRPVKPAWQQRWLWTGISKEASTILFWCWRDEVFGSESSGFGIIGHDGMADQRLSALRKTGNLLKKHKALLDAYRRDPAEVGIFHSPKTYFMHWAQLGNANMAKEAVHGYSRALTRRNFRIHIVEENHLAALSGLKVLFMPRTLVVDDDTTEALSEFVRNGGTLVCESECGAFDSRGIYRYPEDRFLAKLTGVKEVGRRTMEQNFFTVTVGRKSFKIPAGQWWTPMEKGKGKILAKNPDGPLVVNVPVGKGQVILCGTYSGQYYFEGSAAGNKTYAGACKGFEDYVETLVRLAGVKPVVECLQKGKKAAPFVQVTSGRSGGRRMAFVFSDETEKVELCFPAGFFKGAVQELIRGRKVEVKEKNGFQQCRVDEMEWGVAVLVG